MIDGTLRYLIRLSDDPTWYMRINPGLQNIEWVQSLEHAEQWIDLKSARQQANSHKDRNYNWEIVKMLIIIEVV